MHRFFPVLKELRNNNLDTSVGHYFLLVLNLREERFEVLDSMRSLNDNNLRSCCDKIISGIKQCWKTHYAASNKVIDNYDLIDIQVPQQTNK